MGEKSTKNGDFARVWILGVNNDSAVWMRDKPLIVSTAEGKEYVRFLSS
jgi:hypothetical protein